MSKQTMYNAYRAAGMTHAGALAMLGNGASESNLVSYRMQGDFTAGYAKSKAYTASVDSGVLSRAGFVNGVTGYGLYQWTHPHRQGNLYDTARKRGASIGNVDLQVDFSLWELKNEYPGVWSVLTGSESLSECVNIVCRVYENPAIKNYTARYKAAKEIEQALQAYTPQPETPVLPVCWPPRTVDKGMSGADVAVLQALLQARGYYTAGISGTVDDTTDKALRAYQKAARLTVDGVCGPMTWAALIKM